jgi:branched-chain amino acid aminotransferase
MPSSIERLRQLQQQLQLPLLDVSLPPAARVVAPATTATAFSDGPKYAFFEGKIVPIDEAKVSVMTTTLHYGTGCFGGLRAYWSEEKQELFAFRLIEHYTRFLNSCKLLMSELPYTVQDLTDITVELLRKENYRGDVYIRPLHYKADLHGKLQVHDMMDEVTIYACVQPLLEHPRVFSCARTDRQTGLAYAQTTTSGRATRPRLEPRDK